MNQTRYGVSHGCLEFRTERFSGIACLEKSSYFNRKYRFFRLLNAFFIFKNIEFRRVKEFSKLNQIWYGVSHGYLECKTKRIFGIACLAKKLLFRSEISTDSLILFSKI